MRKLINILWLEDALHSGSHSKRVKIVRNYLRKKGYDSNFIFKATFNDAISS